MMGTRANRRLVVLSRAVVGVFLGCSLNSMDAGITVNPPSLQEQSILYRNNI